MEYMKKEYETPEIYIEKYELYNFKGNLCSGVDIIIDAIPEIWTDE